MSRQRGLGHAVIDASALVEFLFFGSHSPILRRLFEDSNVQLHAPSLCDVEATAVIRRCLLHGDIASEEEAGKLTDDLRNLAVERYEPASLLQRTLELRHNFSTYDACYVALAEALGTALLTADAKLFSATKEHTDVSVHLVGNLASSV